MKEVSILPDSEAIYHHRIPQTYMKPWCFSNNSIWTFDKEKNVSKQHNIENILGRDRYHSIRAGSLYTTQESLEKIFGFLKNYSISFEGKKLSSLDELNTHFFDFEQWEMWYPNGKVVNKRDRNIIKQRLISTVDNSIEINWNIHLENDWSNIINILQETLKKIQKKESVFLTIEDAELIMKYLVMFEWRGLKGKDVVNDIFKTIEDAFDGVDEKIPFSKRINFYDDTAIEELKHGFLLREFDSFIKGRGSMYKDFEIQRDNLTFLFWVSDKDLLITSDNPCFSFDNESGIKEKIFVALPNLLITLVKKEPKSPHSYRIMELTSEWADYYNKVIFDNANLVLSKNEYTL